jgi:hypothetical protein
MTMKKNFGLLFILCTMMNNLLGQPAKPSVVGEYYLRGVTETASGFQLKSDSTFQFFYSYGMLDRFGRGVWTLQNDQIILNSRTRPELDFKLLEEKNIPDDSITIVIRDANDALLRYVQCRIQTKDGIREQTTNHEGYAKFKKEPADSLALLFTICPDRFSAFSVHNKNYFVFGLEPWIVEVFFEHFGLRSEANQLVGRHPLIEGNGFRYERASHVQVKDQ